MNTSGTEVEPPNIETTTAHHPRVVDPQTEDQSTESDDEFFDCQDGPAVIVPQPADPPAPTELDSEEVDAPELRSPTPRPVKTLPKVRGIYRLLNLVTERGTGGMSE